VQVLRCSDGAHVCTIGSEGSGNGQLYCPLGGIAIDSDGRIVVADFGKQPAPPLLTPLPFRAFTREQMLQQGAQ